jgi:hypothetical protein
MPADPKATERGIAWIRQHLGQGERVLVWAPGKQNVRRVNTLEALAKRPNAGGPASGRSVACRAVWMVDGLGQPDTPRRRLRPIL